MNDLAEKALDGLAVARRAVRGRPVLSFAVIGFGMAVVVVVAGGAVAAALPTRPLTAWLELQDPARQSSQRLPAALLGTAILALLALWLVVVEFVRRVPQPRSRMWGLAAAWGIPFAVGPPLMDTSVYSYAAYGIVQRRGHDPYQFVPSRLLDSPAVAAVDPGARGTPSGAGPLGSLLQHLSVSISGGSALGAVIVLRVVAVLAVVWLGRSAADLGGRHADRALTLTVLNPLVLLYLVSAAHLDALMIALVLAAVVAATQLRWLRAVVLVCVAGSVLPQAFVLLAVVVAAHVFRRRTASVGHVLGRDVAAAVVVTGVIGLAVPSGFGWLATVGKQFTIHTPYSIAGATGIVLTPIVRGASYDDFAIGGRVTAALAMLCAVVYLVVTARTRALQRSVGYALLAVALFAPALHPWYLLWGTLALAPVVSGRRRVLVLALSAAGCVLAPPGFTEVTTDVLTGVLLVVVATVTAAVLVRHTGAGGAADGSARLGDDARAARGHGRDVARLRALRPSRRSDVDAL